MGSLKFIFILEFIIGLMVVGGILKVTGEVHYYEFVLQESNFTRLCNTKTMLTVNGSFPGPTITVRRGDTFYVNVHNQGTYGVTIHWHGVKQPRNPWSDGPENITQCPIQPGNNFTYQVILSNEEGTLWWHAHNDWTRATVHGAIVVLPVNGAYHGYQTPYHQLTVVIASWFNGDPRAIVEQGLATGSDPGKSDAYTINGQPGDLYPCSNDSTYHLQVIHGKTYLLRIINAVLNEEQFFGIANHNLTIVGQDGAYVKPFTTNYIMITPGQTMDILVTADQTPSYYYMASAPFADAFLASFDNTTTTAILQYNGLNITRPSSIPFPSLPGVRDDVAASNFTSRIRSMDSFGHPFDVPRRINQHIMITIAGNILPCNVSTCANAFRLAASLNNVSFVAKPISILEAYYRNLSGVFDQDFPSDPPNIFNFTGDTTNVSPYATIGTKVKMLNYGDNVEIIFQGTSLLSAGSHPMHVHGFSFYLVGKGTGNFNNETDPKSYNLINPPLINTFGVPKNGWIAIRFVANNPGVWFIHCHIDKHASWGMDTVLIVRNGKTSRTSLRPPPTGMPPCS